MKIELPVNGGDKKTFMPKTDISIDDFIRIDVLKNNLSLGSYEKLVKMTTNSSELSLDMIDGLAYVIVLFEDGFKEAIGLPNEISDILKLPIKQGAILRLISKQISPMLSKLLEDFDI